MSKIEQVKSDEVIEWKNGDECQHKNGIRYTFIGQCDNPKAFDCFLMDSSGNAVLSFINELRKPETESERNERDRIEVIERLINTSELPNGSSEKISAILTMIEDVYGSGALFAVADILEKYDG